MFPIVTRQTIPINLLQASRGKRIISNPNSSVRVKALAASQQALKEEIESLQHIVDRVSDEEIELKKKRQRLAKVKDAMKLTENIMAALMKELYLRRQQTIDKCEEGWFGGCPIVVKYSDDSLLNTNLISNAASQSLDLSSIKKEAKEIGVKSGALEKYGREISENWTALKLENLPTRRVKSGATTASGVDRATGTNTESSFNSESKTSVEESSRGTALVRELDVSQPLSSPTRKALSRLSFPPRQSTPFILETLIRKEDECRVKEGRISARPCVRSLEPLEEAARVWEAEDRDNASATIEAGNKENTHSLSGFKDNTHSLSGFKDKSSFMNGSSLIPSGLGNVNSIDNGLARNGI